MQSSDGVQYIETRSIPEPNSGCWLWLLSTISPNGYGQGFFYGEKLAHRIAYRAHKGSIPTGYEVDHLCCNKPCVNPEHLEAVTPQENMRRMLVRRGYVVCDTPQETLVRRRKRKRAWAISNQLKRIQDQALSMGQ